MNVINHLIWWWQSWFQFTLAEVSSRMPIRYQCCRCHRQRYFLNSRWRTNLLLRFIQMENYSYYRWSHTFRILAAFFSSKIKNQTFPKTDGVFLNWYRVGSGPQMHAEGERANPSPQRLNWAARRGETWGANCLCECSGWHCSRQGSWASSLNVAALR